MRPVCVIIAAITELTLASAALGQAQTAPAQTPTVQQLEQKLREDPGSVPAKQALAEGYLRDCQLDKSLKLWREVLAADPANGRAKRVVERLTTQTLDLDSHLQVLQMLIETQTEDEQIEALLAAAAERAANDGQKARILYLQGRFHRPQEGGQIRARTLFESAAKLYPETPWAGRATVELAEMESSGGHINEARRLLQSVVDDKKQPDDAVRQLARFRLAMLDTGGLTGPEAAAVLRDLLAKTADNEVRRAVLAELLAVVRMAEGRFTPEAIDVIGQMLKSAPSHEETGKILAQLLAIARTSQDALTLDGLLELLARTNLADANLQREASFVQIEALLARAVVEEKPEQVHRFLTSATAALDALAGGRAVFPDRARVGRLRGRTLLIEAQKLAVLQGPQFALPILLKAKGHYLASLAGEPEECFARLAGIGSLLEQMREWETAVALYREIATRFPHLQAGCDSLLKVARICDQKLDSPVLALEVYAEYSARYPAELPYRQLAVGERLRRLGYANLLDFQKRNDLKADGLMGPMTRSKLEELEASFDQIRMPDGDAAAAQFGQAFDAEDESAGGAAGATSKSSKAKPASPQPGAAVPQQPRVAGQLDPHPHPLPGRERGQIPPAGTSGEIIRGEYVHPAIYAIARRLDQAGRHREAIVAYRLFLNLFPSKAQANEALISIARLFRDDLLFDEALGAYRQAMEDFPKGAMTSEAYVEAAGCLENLGRWKEARELYELYARNFPKYPRAAMCKARLALLDELQQYEDFIATSPTSPKLAEAQYQIATLLYKQFGDLVKAAIEFHKVADRYPRHVRAPDALFTAGTAQLKAENFPAARREFAELVARYPESRLADDGQYWIGHTYEYGARALGNLDYKRIVLKRRGLRGRAELAADMALRRAYAPAAAGGQALSPEVWGLGSDVLGVLASGSKRDRVNADLLQAVRAYRQVVDQYKMGDMAGNALLRIGTIYTDYLNDPAKGAEAYQELLAHYPGSKEAVDALFEVGAYQVKEKKFDEAIKSYQQFIYSYQQDPKVEDAMLAIARCHAEKQAWDKALDAYQGYLNKFPAGKYAEKARGQVEWIRMYHF